MEKGALLNRNSDLKFESQRGNARPAAAEGWHHLAPMQKGRKGGEGEGQHTQWARHPPARRTKIYTLDVSVGGGGSDGVEGERASDNASKRRPLQS